MMKSKWFSWILGVSVILMAYQAYAENISVSTFYPSPYGSYTQLDTTTMNVTGAATVGGAATVTGAVTAGSFTTAGALNAATVTATGAVTGGSITTAGAINGASVTATGAVSGATLSANGMTVTGNGGAGTLRVQRVGSDYYCYAVYA